MRRLQLTSLLVGAALVSTIVPAAAAPKGNPNQGGDGASTTAAATIGATEAWKAGHTGEGVGIALIDTGVTPRPGLHGKVFGQVDTSGEARKTDGHGHGTFMAGLMVGDDGPDGPTGIAPDAHVVSFKVADPDGNTDLRSILTALATIDIMADDLNLGVVVLALGGPADEVPDPLEQALERLWARGLVVVVASGNDGDTLTEPGTSPYLLTVGATDDQGTADHSDDVVADWSGHGLGRDGGTKPEVLAPGTSVVSTRVPGSDADRQHPDSRINGQWFRGSGTSMSAAIVGGAAALLLDAHPDLTPNEVKGRLMASATDSPTKTIDVSLALNVDGVANEDLATLDTGSDDWIPESDEIVESPLSVHFGRNWDSRNWVDEDWVSRNWVSRNWVSRNWVSRNWVDQSWDSRNWVSRNWVSRNWVSRNWVSRNWVTLNWDSRNWVSRNWVDQEWADTSWISRNWVGDSWSMKP